MTNIIKKKELPMYIIIAQNKLHQNYTQPTSAHYTQMGIRQLSFSKAIPT